MAAYLPHASAEAEHRVGTLHLERAQTFDGFGGIVRRAEGGQAHVAFSAEAEAHAGGADESGLVEEPVKESPGRGVGGHAHPEVGGVAAAVDLKAHAAQSIGDACAVGQVAVDDLLRFPPALFAVDGLGGALHDVGAAVVLGALAAVPEGIEADLAARAVIDADGVGHDGVGAAQAGETGGLGVAAEFHGHFLRAVDLVDAVGHVVLADEGLVGGVIEDEAAFAAGVVHPGGQRIAAEHRACGVVGIAQVDDVRAGEGEVRHEVVFPRAGQIDEAVPALFGQFSGTAGHDVGIHIDGVDRVHDRHRAVLGKEFLKIAQVAFGPVADEDLVRLEAHAARGVVLRHDGLAQEGIALLRPVAVEARGRAHLVHGLVESRDDGGDEGAAHVADAKADDAPFRVFLAEGGDLAGDVGKEVLTFQTAEVGIDAQHVRSSLTQKARLQRPWRPGRSYRRDYRPCPRRCAARRRAAPRPRCGR